VADLFREMVRDTNVTTVSVHLNTLSNVAEKYVTVTPKHDTQHKLQ